MLIRPFQALFGGPLIRRIGFHARRITREMDRHFFVTLLSVVIGSELYRVALPDAYVGLSIDGLSTRLRGDHRATLLAVTRDGRSLTNPPTGFRLQAGDDAVVVAEGLGELRPLELRHD